MAETDLAALIGPELAGAIAKKGYPTLTPVQEAVLDPALVGRDLRISSQTGSGKTIAIGFTVREVVKGDAAPSPKGAARPRALVVTPTRELAKQVEDELSWLYAPARVRVASVTGGGNYRDERRALGSGTAIVVGTPGRLLDHLQRGAIDGSNLGAVVLDEADRMLDLGFRDDLEAILAFAPEGHRTHLVSATFPREVMALANRVQSDPARIEGTPLGTANTDIEHLVHLVLPHERLDAIVNLMLETPDATTLIFARTRADVGELSRLLSDAGFVVDSLSGEMEQRERNKALAAFKRGDLDALVATDVAARGIDVQDVARVLHAEPPTDADAYTHRSGRTGRAGRKGKSSVLVTPPALNRVSGLLKRAGVRWRIDPVPTADLIETAREERLFQNLTTVPPAEDPAEEPVPPPDGFIEADDRSWALAKRIAEAGEATRALARMIARTRSRGPEARRITPVMPPGSMKRREAGGAPREYADRPAREYNDRPAPREGSSERRPFAEHRTFAEPRGLRPVRAFGEEPAAQDRDMRDAAPRREPGPPRTARDAATDAGNWVPFRISWGQIHGADARRLLAMACRRGGIRGSDVGSIKVTRTYSTIDVAVAAAPSFERATREPDPRDPRVKIRPASEVDAGDDGGPSPGGGPAARTAHVARPYAPYARGAHEAPPDRPSATSASAARKSVPDVGNHDAEPAAPTAEKSVREVAADKPSVRSVREVGVDRPSGKSVREVAGDKPSARSVREVAPERPSGKSVREVTGDRASVKSVREVAVDKPSAKSVREVAVDKPSAKSVREVTADRPSAKSVRDVEADRPSKTTKRTLVVDRSSTTSRNEPKAEPKHEPKAEPKHEPRAAAAAPDAPAARGAARSAYVDRRPRPAQPERYAKRPQPSPGNRPTDDRPRPQHDGPRPTNDRPYDRRPNDGPRPGNDGPRHDGPRPSNDRPRPSADAPRGRPDGGRPPFDRGRPPLDRARPPHDGPRPPHDGPRPGNDRPSNDRPFNDRPSNDRPNNRPPNDRPRPPYAGGGRPSGPPQGGSRQGDARPKRKKP